MDATYKFLRARYAAISLIVSLLALTYVPPEALAQSTPTCPAGINDPTVDCGLPPAITDPNIVDPATGLPHLLTPFSDPVFGATISRVTTVGEQVGNSTTMRNIYAKLQAWNADSSKVLMHFSQILHSGNYSTFSTGPSQGPPDVQWGLNPKWSPTEPNIIYSTWENELRRYDITTGAFVVEQAFLEYSELHKDSAWEEMSRGAPNEGRYTAMVGILPNGNTEVFVFDVIAGEKSNVALAIDPDRPMEIPNWVSVTPRGLHVLARWDSIPAVVAYDIDMNYIGVVAYGNSHSDIAVDADGVEWHVDHAPGDYRVPNEVRGPVVRKSRIPGGIEAYLAGDETAVQQLLTLGWGRSAHVSCRGPLGLGWCVVSTYRGNASSGPLVQEIVKVDLDSRDCWLPNLTQCGETDVRIERLAHHRSQVEFTGGLNCTYWGTPFASTNRDGSKIIFGSTWGSGCANLAAYVIDFNPVNRAPIVDAGIDAVIDLGDSVALNGSASDDGLPEPAGPLDVTWSAVSGPGAVTIADPKALATTATFALSGTYLLRLTADDGERSSSDNIEITVIGENDPIPTSSRVAERNDDAEERSGAVAVRSFDLQMVDYNGSNQQVGLRFPAVDVPAGATIHSAYIQFRAKTGNESGATQLTIAGHAADDAAPFSATANNISARPRTTASVDWQPLPWTDAGATAVNQRTPNIAAIVEEIVNRPNWLGGNALAVIVTGSGTRTAVSFEADAANAALLVLEYFPDGAPPENEPPEVNAGADQTIALGDTAVLDAVVSDDGLPSSPGAVSVQWDASGPGTVTFGDPSATSTTASFSVDGIYQLSLTANDNEFSTSDTLTVFVEPPLNLPPTVNAGADQAIAFGDSAVLDAVVSDDGLPNPPAAVSVQWSQISGPATVSFGDPAAANTTANFSTAGSYDLRVSVSDSSLSADDQLTVVVAEEPPPTGRIVYLTPRSNGSVDGINFQGRDILAYDSANDSWSMFLDGSDVGLDGELIDAFHIDADGSILLSIASPGSLPDVGAIDDSDIVRFTPTATGADTAGDYAWFFDGSDVELASNAEDIDALSLLPDGRLIVSTRGKFVAGGTSGADEDLFAFNAVALGADTTGTWEHYFDGSDIGLDDGNGEDVFGVSVDAGGKIYITTSNTFATDDGLVGDGNDIVLCLPISLGADSGCDLSLYWDGNVRRFASPVEGLHIVPDVGQ